jgi:hypothetical protein
VAAGFDIVAVGIEREGSVIIRVIFGPQAWLAKNPWFEKELVPRLQEAVKEVLQW